nr:hypothetical protein [Pseudomonas sp. GM79]
MPRKDNCCTAASKLQGQIELARLNLEQGREHPLFICARQRDQSRVWTSALFLTL